MNDEQMFHWNLAGTKLIEWEKSEQWTGHMVGEELVQCNRLQNQQVHTMGPRWTVNRLLIATNDINNCPNRTIVQAPVLPNVFSKEHLCPYTKKKQLV